MLTLVNWLARSDTVRCIGFHSSRFTLLLLHGEGEMEGRRFADGVIAVLKMPLRTVRCTVFGSSFMIDSNMT